MSADEKWLPMDELWLQRHDETALQTYGETLTAWENAAGAHDDYELLWRIAQWEHFRALQVLAGENNAPSAKTHLEGGAKRAARAMELERHRVEGWFWSGVCVLEAARLGGTFASARALSPSTRQIERAMAIDEGYNWAGPLRVLGRITHFKPLILGGSVDRALDVYRRALQIVPDNSTTLLYYSEALLADQQNALARQTLQNIINAPDDAEWKWEQARDRNLAQTLIENMNRAL